MSVKPAIILAAVAAVGLAGCQHAKNALGMTKVVPDEFRVVGREIYARFPNGLRDSKLATVLGGARLGVTPTGRNWNTVKKILELADR